MPIGQWSEPITLSRIKPSVNLPAIRAFIQDKGFFARLRRDQN